MNDETRMEQIVPADRARAVFANAETGYSQKQRVVCWSRLANGDVVGLVMRKNGLVRARLLPSGFRHSYSWLVGVAVSKLASGRRKPNRQGNCNHCDCTHWVFLVHGLHAFGFRLLYGWRPAESVFVKNGFTAI